MSVAAKLQIEPGHRVVVLQPPLGMDLGLDVVHVGADPVAADAVVLFITRAGELSSPEADAVVAAAARDALAWVAYPSSGQLDTDLNRDVLAAALAEHRIRAVGQVSIDDVWSALRFRPAR